MPRLVAAILLLLVVAPAAADKTKEGRAVFDSCVAWIRGMGPALPAVTSAHLRFADVKIDDEAESGRHHEGHLELWFQSPDKFREEWRSSSRDKRPLIKLLDGGKAWIKPAGSEKWKRQHGAGGAGAGTAAVAQLKRDLKQLADLARFLSPTSLNGKGVTWTLEGAQRLTPPLAPKGSPAFRRVRRRAPGEPDMVFFFAVAPASSGVKAGYHPHAVGIQGDAAKGRRQEWFVLDRWRRTAKGTARPARIQGFAPAKAGTLRRFVLLFPEQVELNPKLPSTLFGPKTPR